jgi:hypothetical protein
LSERLPYSLHNADQKLDRHVLRLTAADERKKAPIDPLAGNASLIVTGISQLTEAWSAPTAAGFLRSKKESPDAESPG